MFILPEGRGEDGGWVGGYMLCTQIANTFEQRHYPYYVRGIYIYLLAVVSCVGFTLLKANRKDEFVS